MNKSDGKDSSDGENQLGANRQFSAFIGAVIRSSISRAVIIFFLAASMNGVFNFFGHPAMQMYPFFLSICAAIWFLAFQSALHFRNIPWIFMIASAVTCSFFALVTEAIDRKIALNENRYPHFVFSVLNRGNILDRTDLTNDFLAVSKFGVIKTNIPGILVFPTSKLSNVVFCLMVSNAGPETMESGEVTFGAIKSLSIGTEPGWLNFETGGVWGEASSSLPAQPVDSRLIKLPTILPGNGNGLPYLCFSNIPWQKTGDAWFPVSIMGRAKDGPAQAVSFLLWIVPVSTNASSKPFIIRETTNIPVIPLEKLKELMR